MRRAAAAPSRGLPCHLRGGFPAALPRLIFPQILAAVCPPHTRRGFAPHFRRRRPAHLSPLKMEQVFHFGAAPPHFFPCRCAEVGNPAPSFPLILLETIQDSFALTRSPSLSAAAPTLLLFLLAAARPRTLARLTMPARGQGFVFSARPTAADRFFALVSGRVVHTRIVEKLSIFGSCRKKEGKTPQKNFGKKHFLNYFQTNVDICLDIHARVCYNKIKKNPQVLHTCGY